MQIYSGGEHKKIPLFADFEDWTQGTLGWESGCDEVNSIRCEQIRNQNSTTMPKGAHWSPFDFESLGPSIPSFNTSKNEGLVLNAGHLSDQVQRQRAWILDIEKYIKWIHEEINTTSLEAHTRFRKNIQLEMRKTLHDYEEMLRREEEKFSILASSQCANIDPCTLLFNTSDLTLTGAINAKGSIGLTESGDEVAIWAFDSINIGSEVDIVLAGQRALVLLSKSSVMIDTHLISKPGTLGGFPGGYSVSRNNRLQDVCHNTPDMKHRAFACEGDYGLSEIHSNTISNNINGPGSGSVRIYSFM